MRRLGNRNQKRRRDVFAENTTQRCGAELFFEKAGMQVTTRFVASSFTAWRKLAVVTANAKRELEKETRQRFTLFEDEKRLAKEKTWRCKKARRRGRDFQGARETPGPDGTSPRFRFEGSRETATGGD